MFGGLVEFGNLLDEFFFVHPCRACQNDDVVVFDKPGAELFDFLDRDSVGSLELAGVG